MKLFYSIEELGDALNETSHRIANALNASGIPVFFNGKRIDPADYDCFCPLESGGSLTINLSHKPDPAPNTCLVVYEALPESWKQSLATGEQEITDETDDISAKSTSWQEQSLAIDDETREKDAPAPAPALAEFRNMQRLSWNEIQIDFVAGESGSILLSVSARGITRRITLAEIELINRKTGETNYQGGVLLALAQKERLPTTQEMAQRVTRLRKVLKRHFGIDSEPIDVYNTQSGYMPLFEISDKRNSADERARKNAERKTISLDDWNEQSNDDPDDETTQWFKEHAPDMLEDDDLS